MDTHAHTRPGPDWALREGMGELALTPAQPFLGVIRKSWGAQAQSSLFLPILPVSFRSGPVSTLALYPALMLQVWGLPGGLLRECLVRPYLPRGPRPTVWCLVDRGMHKCVRVCTCGCVFVGGCFHRGPPHLAFCAGHPQCRLCAEAHSLLTGPWGGSLAVSEVCWVLVGLGICWAPDRSTL